ncbi:MAG TPA: sigma-54 dependent transcriptional regulator [Planctomycetota bacterium]|nr:sigma-54 dependent transcriptional regulator [Planctomycetota bacterium]
MLVIDDDADFRTSLALLLTREGALVETAESLETARAKLSTNSFDALFVDQELPDGQGLALLQAAPERGSGPEVVMITGYATVDRAVDAIKLGALDYLTKPLDHDKLESTLVHLRRTRVLKQQVSDLRDELRQRGRFASLIGRSSAMQPVFDLIQRVAPTNASVLIQGESGTGKEIVAGAIHELSRRADKVLLALNCGAIPESLIESELFGHEKGSFTGADKQLKGHFERADGGTLFLDEVTEMPLEFQVRLLRVLESGMVHRIGGSAPISTDVRVLAATNRDPLEAIRQGKLREDLYFRLAVFPMLLPPLRERPGDVPLLAQHFLDSLNEAGSTDKRWGHGALEALNQREWKGNVRELKNAVQRAYILADDTLRAEDTVAFTGRAFAKDASPLDIQVGTSIASAERELIQATLLHVRGDKPAAAAILGISLKTLYNRLNVYDASKAGDASVAL